MAGIIKLEFGIGERGCILQHLGSINDARAHMRDWGIEGIEWDIADVSISVRYLLTAGDDAQ